MAIKRVAYVWPLITFPHLEISLHHKDASPIVVVVIRLIGVAALGLREVDARDARRQSGSLQGRTRDARMVVHWEALLFEKRRQRWN